MRSETARALSRALLAVLLAVRIAVAARAAESAPDPLAALPAWPEDLGALTAASRDSALSALPEGGAALEIHRALLHLAPLPDRDASSARAELTRVADRSSTDVWTGVARYALAWLEEIEGSLDAARNAYREIVLADPDSEAGRRAATAFGRLELRRGQPAEAAVWLQAAIDRGGAPGAADLREDAVRRIVREASAARSREVDLRSDPAELREVSAIARMPAGDMVAADRKRDLVLRFDAQGHAVRTWPLRPVGALAVDPFGRVFVAAGDAVMRLDAGEPSVVARSGSYGGISALAVDAAGRIWIADRRGDRVGIAREDGSEPRTVRANKGQRVEALAWDGKDVLALVPASGRIEALAIDGHGRVVVEGLHGRSSALAANGAGEVAWLDEGEIRIASSVGAIVERIDARGSGVQEPTALALGPDGRVDCFDRADGRVARFR